MAIDRKDWLSIEHAAFQKNRLAIDKSDLLLIEQISCPQNRLAINGADWLWIERAVNRNALYSMKNFASPCVISQVVVRDIPNET